MIRVNFLSRFHYLSSWYKLHFYSGYANFGYVLLIVFSGGIVSSSSIFGVQICKYCKIVFFLPQTTILLQAEEKTFSLILILIEIFAF